MWFIYLKINSEPLVEEEVTLKILTVVSTIFMH